MELVVSSVFVIKCKKPLDVGLAIHHTVCRGEAMKRCEVPGCPEWETCSHHIVSVGARGSSEKYNLMTLCVWHHAEFHNHGWRTFCAQYPELEDRIISARKVQGKRT